MTNLEPTTSVPSRLLTLHKIEHFLHRHHLLVLCSVVVVGLILSVSRHPDVVLNPQFWAEDGKCWYAQAYNQGFSSLFYSYGGYLVMFYHLVALVSLLLPFRLAPLFFSLTALVIQLTPLLLINSNRLRKVIPYRSLAIVISFLYLSIPNASEVFGNLTNVQWHLGVTAFLILIAESSRLWKWHVFDILILLATGLSGPLVIMLLPIAFLLWLHKHSDEHRRNMVLLAVLALVQLLYISVFNHLNRAGGQPNINLLLPIKMVVGQIFMGSLLGQKHVAMYYSHPLILILLLAIGLSLILYALLHGPLWLKLFSLYSLFIFIATLLLKPVNGSNVWLDLTAPGASQRYWYIPMLVWLSILLWLLVAAKIKLLRVVAGVLVLLLFTVGIPGSWQIPPLPDLHFQAYAKSFQSVKPGDNYTIPINPGWEMVLTKR